MKKIFFASIVLLFTSFAVIACSDDDDNDYTWKKFSEIPASAQQFVKDHFSAQDGTFDETSIVEIKQEKNGDYEVKFSSRVEVDFYTNGVWKEIDTNGNTLPNTIAMLIPEKALSYISTKYPTAIIEEIEKQGAYGDTQNIKIELRDDRDIIFDYLGNVISDHGATSGDDDQIMKPEDLHVDIQTFLDTYFEGKTPNLVKKEWDEYEVVFNHDTKEEVEIEFTTDYKFKSVSVEGNNPIIRDIIKGVSNSESILAHLDKHHPGQVIEEFSIASSLVGNELKGGYVVETEGNEDYKIYFKSNGEHFKTIKD